MNLKKIFINFMKNQYLFEKKKNLIFSFIFFFSVCPSFLLEFYLDFNIVSKALIYFTISVLFSYLIFQFLKKLRDFFISIILVFLIDINMDIYLLFASTSFFNNYYLFDLLIKLAIYIFFFLVLFILIYKQISSKNSINTYFFLFFLFFFLNINNLLNFFFNPNFNSKDFTQHNFEKNIYQLEKEKTLIIYLDEMIGIGGIDQGVNNSRRLANSFYETYTNNNFKVYKNAYTKYLNTVESIPATLNFDFQNITYNIENYANENLLNRNSRWNVISNKFFDQFIKKKILATHNKALNYCLHPNVDFCYRSTAKNFTDKFDGFKPSVGQIIFYTLKQTNGFFNRVIWKILNGSNQFIDYSVFSFEKANFPNNLEEVNIILNNSDFDLYFFHMLTPHKPYGIKYSDNLCSFDEKLINKKFSTLYFEKEQHYQEIICTNHFMDNFLKKLSNDSYFDNFRILILSDTGTKFRDSENIIEELSVLFAIKESKKKKNQIKFR